MKKVKLSMGVFIMLLLTATHLSAQTTYDVFYNVDAGNPSNVKSTVDGTITGYTQLSNGGESSNFWSSTYAIPFAFNFYGNAVTHLKVSGNGVLTFDTLVTAIPNDTNTNLPTSVNSNIPNLSILGLWDAFSGSAPIASTDRIWAKVHGTAPYRQLWIEYYSYEYGNIGSSQAASYVYFSFVLEEGTNNVFVVDHNYSNGGENLTATVGVQENGKSAVQYGTDAIAMGTGTNAILDNDYYQFIPRLRSTTDAAVVSIDAPTLPVSSGSNMVSVTIANDGTDTLRSVVVNWMANGIAQTPFNYTGLLATNERATVNLGTYNFNGTTDIDVWTSLPNNSVDGNQANDNVSVRFYTALSGVVTVDLNQATNGTNYNNFGDLMLILNKAGIDGPLTVNVASGTYNEQLTIGSITGTSAMNTITISGDSAHNTIISHDRSLRNSTVTFEGASYITFKKMTVIATAQVTDTWGIFIFDSTYHVHIDSNIIIMPVGSTGDIAGINMAGSETSDNFSGLNGYHITISNNTVTGGERGITLYGDSDPIDRNSNLTVINNNTQNADDHGIYVYGFDTVNISNNYSVNATNNTTNDGMFVSELENFIIGGNYAKGSDNGFYAEKLNYEKSTTSQSSFFNNIIIGGDDGLYLYNIENVNIYHNSTFAEDRGIHIEGDLNLNIRNNIFSSNSDYAFYSDALSPSMVLNYNIYHTLGTDLAYFSTPYTTFADFRTGQPTLNVNSLAGDPVYISPTSDLHVKDSLAFDAGDNTVGILVDFDGDLRPMLPTSIVDIGADEFIPVVCALPNSLMTSTITTTSALLSWIEAGNSIKWEVEYDTANFTIGTGNATIVNVDTFTTITGLNPTTSYDWYVRSICAAGDTSIWIGPINFSTLTPLPYYPIGTINTEDAVTGVADSLGVFCWTSGTVAGIDLDGNVGISFTIIDQSGTNPEGMNIYNFADVSNYVVTEGDSIMVRGEIQQFNGLTELFPDSIRIISTGASLPAAVLVTTLDESVESALIRMEDLIVTSVPTGTSINIGLTDGTNNFVMRVDSDTDVLDSLTFVVGDRLCSVNGIGGQFDNSNPYLDGYQIFPMSYSDVVFAPSTDLGADTIVCDTNGFVLDAGNFSSYVWSTGALTRTITPTTANTVYSVIVTDGNGCTGTDTVNVTVTVCVGVNEAKQAAASINFFPNPNNGQFKLQIENVTARNSSLEIVNIQGQVVYNENLIVNGSLSKDINLNVEKGIYFVRLINKNGVKIEKLIIE
jgi:hypothetical protein